MLTPQEIQDKKFEKAVFGGYDMGQIDQFLDDLLVDYSALYKENAALKAKMRVLVDKIEEYRSVDEEMRKALFTAQVTARDIVEKAQKEADGLLQGARSDAQKHVTDLQGETEAEERRLGAAKDVCAEYASKIRTLLEKNIQVMETIMERPADSFRADAKQPEPEQPAPAAAPPAEAPAAAPQQPVADDAPAVAKAEPGAEDTRFFEVDLGEQQPEAPAPAAEPDDDSDTARIYGAGPYTPKPRFNFSDLRFGKDYKEDDDK